MKKSKGITLVTLIITIIVMLILVGVSIALAINSDILGTAKEAGETYTEKAEEEANVSEIVVNGITYASIRDWKNNNPKISKGQYEAINGVYVNRPDLTGFNIGNTYFVTYDEKGNNETIGEKITAEEPSNWYNYQNKIWANIVTASEELTASEKADITTATTKNIAYLVWIPRYCYKITYYEDSGLTTLAEAGTITSYGTIDIKFLSRSNVHKDYATGTETPYSTFEEDGYILPETFTWKAGTDDETALAGYWVGKYEISEGVTTEGIKLQSKSTTTLLKDKSASEFFLLCRQIETENGALGLNATIEVQNNKVVETSSSNNIDAHMIKNTEWGTIAILSASIYGGSPTMNRDNTSGNASGVMKMAGGAMEYVAGIWDNSASGNIKYIYNADSWYKNVYTSETGIPGDATLETLGWLGTDYKSFINYNYPCFLRFVGIFGFNNYYRGSASTNCSSRFAIVNGKGI